MTVLDEKGLHACLEKIAERGCAEVNRLIEDAEKGITIPDITHLDTRHQEMVLQELKSLMSVYVDNAD